VLAKRLPSALGLEYVQDNLPKGGDQKTMYVDYHYYQPPIGRLLQLVPAEPGWYAVYGLSNRQVEQERIEKIEKQRLAFWAVVQRFEYEGIFFVGVIRKAVELMMLPETWNGLPFLGYGYPECEVDWEYEAERKYEQQQKAKE
jgi:hypothetical protein